MAQASTSADSTTGTTGLGAGTVATSASALDSPMGRTTIADTVVSKIAGIAARDVVGVHALGGGASRAVASLRDRIPGGRTNFSQGVAVEVGEKQAGLAVGLVGEELAVGVDDGRGGG